MLFNDHTLIQLHSTTKDAVHQFQCVHSQVSINADNENCLISAVDAPCVLGATHTLRDGQYLAITALDVNLIMQLKNHVLTVCFI